MVLQWASLCPKSTFRSSALLGVSKVPGAAGRCSPPPHLHARPRPLASVILVAFWRLVSSCDMDHDTVLGFLGPSSAREWHLRGRSRIQPRSRACPNILSSSHTPSALPLPSHPPTAALSAQPCSSFPVLPLCLPVPSVLSLSSSLLSLCQGFSWGGGLCSRCTSSNPGSPSKWLSNHVDQIALDLGS